MPWTVLLGARKSFPSAERGRALPQPFDKLRGTCGKAYPAAALGRRTLGLNDK
jgi:hypothetical protein